jgi:hypothetical protein
VGVVTLFTFVSLAACEDDATSGGGGDGGAGPAVTPPPGSGGAFCDKTIGAVSRALEGCCTAEDKATDDYGFIHGIVVALTPVCTGALDRSIDAGRVAYHPDRAEACFAAYEATYAAGACANITETFADPSGTACGEAFSGLGGPAAPCAGDHECEDGLTCVGYTRNDDGACTAPPAIGEPCGPGRAADGSREATTLEFGDHPPCAAGARCDGSDGTCVAAGAAGASCFEDDACAAPLGCKMGECSAEGPSAAGGACLSHDDCEVGLYCDAPAGGGPGACAVKRTAGAACTVTPFDSECAGRCAGESGEPGTCASFCGSR